MRPEGCSQTPRRVEAWRIDIIEVSLKVPFSEFPKNAHAKIYPVMGVQIDYSVFVRIYFVYCSRAQAKYLLTNTVVGHGGDNRRICIQPQSRRSSHYCMTMIKRPLSRVFQFQGSQHSFQDYMDYTLPGLH